MTYTVHRTFERGGVKVVEIRGGVRPLFVHREQGRYFQWDRPGVPVRNEDVIDLVEAALKVPRPIAEGPHPDRQCARCSTRFSPKGPCSYICEGCKSVSMVRAPRKVEA